MREACGGIERSLVVAFVMCAVDNDSCGSSSGGVGAAITPWALESCSGASTKDGGRGPSRLIAASIGVAIPKDPEQFGYLSEHHAHGESEQTAGDYAEDLAATMLATILNVPFDPDEAWNERRMQWELSGKIVKTTNVTQTAEGPDNGDWVSVVTAAVLLP